MNIASKTFKYQNYLLTLMWLSGLLKSYMYAYGFKFDIVIFALVLVVIDIIFQFVIRKVIFSQFSLNLFIFILIFYTWMIFSMLYSSSNNYMYIKTGDFLVNIVFFLYPIFIKKINFNIIIKLYSIVLLPLSVFYIYMNSLIWKMPTESTEIFMQAGFDYLGLGFHLGILFIVLNYFKKSIWVQMITLLLLLASAARGPLIFILFIALIMNSKHIFSLRIKNLKSLSLVFGIGTLLFFTFFEQIYPFLENSISRLTSLASGHDHSTELRISMMRFAFYQPFESFFTFFFGNGIGSFGVLFNNFDGRAYPHNILLEVFFELGFIGFLLLIVMLLLLFIKFSLKRSVFYPLFLFAFLDVMKSSNITDLWIFFAFIGGISIYSIHSVNDNIPKNHKQESL